jgi:threonine synthase
MKSYLTGLECSTCGRRYSADELHNTCECGGSLLADYDLHEVTRVLSREDLVYRIHSLWRYHDLLPIRNADNMVTLNEGFTPLLSSTALGPAMGFQNLMFKDESWNPTGSFKARGLCVAVSKARELGVGDICLPTAGNAGGAAAAYAARAGLGCHVFMPSDTPDLFALECAAYGAEVVKVDGLIGDAAFAMQSRMREGGWFDVSTCKEPYRVEGKKTIMLEVASQMGWSLPDAMIFPTGGGTGIIGAWKACREMSTLGWIPRFRMPRLISVQAEGCAPVVRALESGATTVEPWQGASTTALGLRVAGPFAGALILRAIRDSGGTAVAVSDEAIAVATRDLARREGLYVAPEAGAGLAALRALQRSGLVDPREKVVLLLTGCGLKYSESARI